MRFVSIDVPHRKDFDLELASSICGFAFHMNKAEVSIFDRGTMSPRQVHRAARLVGAERHSVARPALARPA